jgi:hypothetical protein
MALCDRRRGWKEGDTGLGFLDAGVWIDGERERQGVLEFVPELVFA